MSSPPLYLHILFISPSLLLSFSASSYLTCDSHNASSLLCIPSPLKDSLLSFYDFCPKCWAGWLAWLRTVHAAITPVLHMLIILMGAALLFPSVDFNLVPSDCRSVKFVMWNDCLSLISLGNQLKHLTSFFLNWIK